MISEGLCDTEDWSNDAENSALIRGINYIRKYIKIENYKLKKLHFTILLFFYQINVTLVSIRDLKLLNGSRLRTYFNISAFLS